MSFVFDQIHRIDAQLDRLQLAPQAAPSRPSTGYTATTTEDRPQPPSQRHEFSTLPSARILALQAAVRALSAGSSERAALVKPHQIQLALSTLSSQPEAAASVVEEEDAEGTDEEYGRGRTGGEEKDAYETELEWLLVSKATTQVYGAVLKRILDQAVDIADDIWYWDEVLGSRRGTLLYSAQIFPLRLWHWGSIVWADVQARGGHFSVRGAGREAGDTLGKRWQQFYGLVREVVKEKSVQGLHKQMLSPVTRIRAEVRLKQAALKKIRVRNANALGVLLGEGLANECVHGEGIASPTAENAGDVQTKWKVSVGRNVALMEAVLAKTADLEMPVDKFDSAIAELTDDDPLYAVESHQEVHVSPQDVAERLNRLLALGLPQYSAATKALVQEHGRPSRFVRYWLPVTIGILSSSTILRILVNRQAEIIQWVRDLGTTVVDFWTNWVVEPTSKLIKTIRHDEGSEISIMSKRSLEGDRESLERMVVDFAVDNPANASASGARLTEAEIEGIRAKVREGDLTPVLRAYEKDLTSPLMGAVRGNLIRALLIQIQKTKVDVEIAMGGIDALLKSQELLIGFISLTPGLLVAYGALRWIRSTSLFSSSSALRQKSRRRNQGLMIRQLRNIDRILTAARPTDFGELLYRDQGLLICEVHVLRQEARKVFPAEILREFGEEAEELCDVRIGVERQKKVEERIRWAYGRWLA